ncbi:MAG: nuclear transport factor 2 family protein [Kineosporiaceae bacterium]
MTQATLDTDAVRRIGENVVAALAAKDFDRLRAALADDVRFRLLVPKGPQSQEGPDETVARFARWYGEADELWLESSSVGTVGDRLVLAYRIRLHDADGWQVIEQHLVGDATPDGRLRAIDLLCTGFHADAGTSASGGREENEEERS